MDGLTRYQDDIARIAEGPCPYPEGHFSGAGIVVCAGGRLYYTCAWVLVNALRALGCRLPIEVWHRGQAEMNGQMRRLLESVEGVRCVDAYRACGGRAACRLNGWEIKPYAIIHSRFEDVLFIDCDNVPTRDPSFLLDSRPYHRLGAIFWPDRWTSDADRDELRTIDPRAWQACGVAPRNEPEFESGQMVINKRRCWKALQMAMFLNEHSDFFYHLLLGDKDTFHMAWRRLGQDYAMPTPRLEQNGFNGPVLYQHDFHGRRIFQHRNQDKWNYGGGNLRIADFQHEELCFHHLGQLRRRWDGVVRRFPDDYTPTEQQRFAEITAARLFRYRHDGIESRLVELRPDFKIGLGKGEWETDWEIEDDGEGGVSLTFRNALRKMCVLRPTDAVAWTGRCLHFERLPMVVEPITSLPGPERRAANTIADLLPRLPQQGGREARKLRNGRTFLYRRVGCDARPMELLNDHTIGRGAAGCERWWYVDHTGDGPRLVIWGDHGPTCSLRPGPHGIWTGQWEKFERMPVELIPDPTASGGGPEPYYGSDSASSPQAYYGVSASSRRTYY